jgi:3-hydroxyacyl-CoA dehydrogenase
MSYQIKRAMVIGSGVMGGGIAGHLANAGIPVYLVDIVPRSLTKEEEAKGLTLENPVVRNRIVNQGMEFLKKSRPPGLFSPSRLELISAGNMEDNWDWIKESDWIIEVVVENLAIKH